MPANRRRSAATAPYDRWVLLGSLLELRRRTLGHTYRKSFERDCSVNARLAADIEKAAKERVNTFMPGTLQLIARGYAVTYESVLAVLRGETDDLVPAAVPPPVPVPAAEDPPYAPARATSDRRYFDEIQGRLDLLRARGIAEPSGRQLFPDAPDDAKAWDGIGARLDIGDRVWFIADLRRRAAGRAGGSGANSHGALRRGNVAGTGVMPGLPVTPVTVYRIQRTCRLRNCAASRTKKFWGSSRCARCGATRDGGSPGRARPGRDSDGRTRAEKSSGTRFTRVE